MTDEKPIRRRENTAPDKDSARAKLAKVSRIRILDKNLAIVSPKKCKFPSKKRKPHSSDTSHNDHDLDSLNSSVFSKVENLGTTRKNFRKKRRVVKYAEQS